MRIALVHNPIASAAPEDQDLQEQVDGISAALARLGHDAIPVECGLNLEKAAEALRRVKPDVIFNLVEAIAGTDRLMVLATALFEALQIPFTGSSSEAILVSSNKLLAKRWLKRAGLPTAPWIELPAPGRPKGNSASFHPPYIVKAQFEHASIGMTDEAVTNDADLEALYRRIEKSSAALGKPCFAEKFIEGREFNVGVLEGRAGLESLPPAEILFENYPTGKPRIVGYHAKWTANSAEYVGTPRTLEFKPSEAPLLAELRQLALEACRLFEVGGYARVDFRVDRAGRPWILEVNCNPCLTPEAGFWAMLEHAQLTYDQSLNGILNAARGSPAQSAVS